MRVPDGIQLHTNMDNTIIPRTQEECDQMEAATRKYLYENYEYDETFTCKDCPARFTCEWAFDLYNTEGDCLAEK